MEKKTSNPMKFFNDLNETRTNKFRDGGINIIGPGTPIDKSLMKTEKTKQTPRQQINNK